MASLVDIVLGLLLGASAFYLMLAYVSYRRSGVCSMRLLSEGLLLHVLFTAFLLSAGYATDWLEKVHGPLVVAVDAIVLFAVVALARLGGRPGA